MRFLGWSILLILQNAAFTWVSRARNSSSLGYHAVAACFSNGIFFASNLILIDIAIKALKTPSEIVAAMLVYVASTVTGSVLMHYVSMRYLEKGKRKVGQ